MIRYRVNTSYTSIPHDGIKSALDSYANAKARMLAGDPLVNSIKLVRFYWNVAGDATVRTMRSASRDSAGVIS
jgi:hypothetical protein